MINKPRSGSTGQGDESRTRWDLSAEFDALRAEMWRRHREWTQTFLGGLVVATALIFHLT